MRSVGNDIVSLAAINPTRTVSKNFYSKFILPAEEGIYTPALQQQFGFEEFVWALWAVKESVYKCAQRHNPGLVFSPSKIIVENMVPDSNVGHASTAEIPEHVKSTDVACYSSIVTWGNCTYFARSAINQLYIHSIALANSDFETAYFGIKLIDDASPENQSAQARLMLLEQISSILNIDNLQVIKNDAGCPSVFSGDTQLAIPISLSHHGNCVAYAFTWAPTK